MKTVFKVIGCIILLLCGWFIIRFVQEIVARKKKDEKTASKQLAAGPGHVLTKNCPFFILKEDTMKKFLYGVLVVLTGWIIISIILQIYGHFRSKKNMAELKKEVK